MSQPTQNAAPGSVRAIPLWASAFVIGAMILIQGARVSEARPARMGEVSELGDFVILTADAGSDEVLLVLDSRNEQLYVYSVANQRSVELLERQSLARIFTVAKGEGAGRTTR